MGRGSQTAQDPFLAVFGGRRGSSRLEDPDIPLHELIEHPGVSSLAFAALERLIASGDLYESLLAAHSCLGALQGLEDIEAPQGDAQHFLAALLRHLATASQEEWLSHKETAILCKFCGIDKNDAILRSTDFCLRPLHAHLLDHSEQWHERVLEREDLLHSARDSFPRALCALSAQRIYEELHRPTPSRETLRRVLGRGGIISLRHSLKNYQKKARSGAVDQTMSFFDALPKVSQDKWLHALEIAVLGSWPASPGRRFDRPKHAARERRATLFMYADNALTDIILDRDHPDIFRD